MSTISRGLTAAEVAERVSEGLTNRVRRSDVAEYLDILQRNLLTVFNALVMPAAVVLLWLGDYKAGFAVSGMMIVNTFLGLFQEIRAKKQLDRLTLLAESRVRVVRDGETQEVAAGDVVQGDFLLLTAGDSVVADGEVLETRYLEIDEALLTGESDPVARKVGDQLLSGSFCVAGEGAYRADRVGSQAFAQKTSHEARAYQYSASPLQEQIDRLIRILSVLAVVLSLCYLLLYSLRGTIGERELVRMVAATITSMVPQGLVLMATLALLLGALTMSKNQVVVNRLAAVEAMSSIDTLCMDKTGTLTTNQLTVAAIEPLGDGPVDAEAHQALALFAWNSLDRQSKSLVALRAHLPEQRGELLDQVPFKSQNRYSAVRVKHQDREWSLVLGAVEALRTHLVDSGPIDSIWKEKTQDGRRLLLFGEVIESPRTEFAGSLDGFRLRALALVALSDELRPEASEVLHQLADQNIRFKILSGDNPETVRATVAPLSADPKRPALAALTAAPVVTGPELEASSHPAELIQDHAVFGRVSPWQKVQIVRGLTAEGHRVAMIGDGVNDVLPIKNATLGIAMGDGSRAAKTVAGIVLQTNDFALLPRLLDEGRIIVRNLRRSGKLFLTKNVYTLILIVGTLGIFNLDFPFAPQQVTLLNFLTIGVPALFITLDRRRAPAAAGEFVRVVGWFALRTGCITGVAALAMMLISARVYQDDEPTQRTMVLTTLIFLGWVTLWRVVQQWDRVISSLPIIGLAVYLGVMYWSPLASFFELAPLDPFRWSLALGMTCLGALGMWLGDRLFGRAELIRGDVGPSA
ncbi:MAG: cation-translocating P-type ATPase [Gemmataceae bacterium]